MVEYSVGFCYPGDCFQPGASCPAGFTCQHVASDPVVGEGWCVRTGGADGGVPDAGH
jgi:hypothetical protein